MPTMPATVGEPIWGIPDITIPNMPGSPVTQWDETAESVSRDLKDQLGATVYRKVYDRHYTATASVIVAASDESGIPEEGSTITVGEHAWFVNRVSRSASSEDFLKITIELERFENTPAKA